MASLAPQTLAAAANCFCSVTSPGTVQMFRLALLSRTLESLGISMTVPQLVNYGKCYGCLGVTPGEQAELALLDLISQFIGGASGCDYQDMQVAWEPTSLKLGENVTWDLSSGVTGLTKLQFLQAAILSADVESCNDLLELDCPHLISVAGAFTAINLPALTIANLPVLVNVGGDFSITTSPGSLVSLNLSSLTSVGGVLGLADNNLLSSIDLPSLTTVGLDFYADGMPNLTSISMPLLNSVGVDLNLDNIGITAANFPSLAIVTGKIFIDSCPAIQSIQLPLLVSSAGLYFDTDPLLTSVSIPNFIPVNGNTINCSGSSLNAASVQLILRRCVLAGVTTCTIDLSGGTNAGLLSLSVQGQADYAALFAAGNTITLNP